MILRTRELTGAALAWAAGTAVGETMRIGLFGPLFSKGYYWPMYNGNWKMDFDANPQWVINLMERRRIAVEVTNDGWQATPRNFDPASERVQGNTIVEAVLRHIVITELGEEVDIPEKLVDVIPTKAKFFGD
jgi:hypothetical protein